MSKILFSVLLLVIIGISPLANAEDHSKNLIPCGWDKDDPCRLSDLGTLADNVINFLLFNLAMPLAVVSFLTGGVLMITAGGNESQLERGKSVFRYAIIGFILAFGAWLIIELVVTVLITEHTTLKEWLKAVGLQ